MRPSHSPVGMRSGYQLLWAAVTATEMLLASMPGQRSPGGQVLCVRAPSCGQHLPCVPLQLLDLQGGQPSLPDRAVIVPRHIRRQGSPAGSPVQ